MALHQFIISLCFPLLIVLLLSLTNQQETGRLLSGNQVHPGQYQRQSKAVVQDQGRTVRKKATWPTESSDYGTSPLVRGKWLIYHFLFRNRIGCKHHIKSLPLWDRSSNLKITRFLRFFPHFPHCGRHICLPFVLAKKKEIYIFYKFHYIYIYIGIRERDFESFKYFSF